MNILNLWMGDGPTNQIIGFLSTPLAEYGEKLRNHSEVFTVKKMNEIVKSALSNLRGGIKNHALVVDESIAAIHSVLINCKDGTERGEILMDIGENLGFDLIDDATEEDERIRRHRMLIDVDIQLRMYIQSNGNVGNLVQIFREFLDPSAPEERVACGADEAQAARTAQQQETLAREDMDEPVKERLYIYQRNNCLIDAIAQFCNVHVDIQNMIQIRNQLNDRTGQPPGNLLDPSNGDTAGYYF